MPVIAYFQGSLVSAPSTTTTQDGQVFAGAEVLAQRIPGRPAEDTYSIRAQGANAKLLQRLYAGDQVVVVGRISYERPPAGSCGPVPRNVIQVDCLGIVPPA